MTRRAAATGRTVGLRQRDAAAGEMVPGPAGGAGGAYERHVLGGRGPAVAPGSGAWCARPRRTPWRGPRRAGAHPQRPGWWSRRLGATTCTRSPAGSPGARRGRPRGACGRRRRAGGWGRPRVWWTRSRPTCSGPPWTRLTAETGYLARTRAARRDRRIAALASLIAVRRTCGPIPMRPRPRAGRADRRRVPAAGHTQRAGLGGVDAVLRPVLARSGRRAHAGRRRLRGRAAGCWPPPAAGRGEALLRDTCSADPRVGAVDRRRHRWRSWRVIVQVRGRGRCDGPCRHARPPVHRDQGRLRVHPGGR